MKDELANDVHCPFEGLCERVCFGDYELCYRETLSSGVNPYGKVIKHPHIVVMYEGKRAGKSIEEKKKCIIATLSGCDDPTLAFYRGFRDNFMSKTMMGKRLIEFYYAVSPSIVVTVLRFDIMKILVKKILTTLKTIRQKRRFCKQKLYEIDCETLFKHLGD
jgi:hypothetical protein